jgi:glycosyltransferase involved in cell wall biosynthesis
MSNESRQPKQKRLRILISSNAPWSTSGYGQAVFDLLPLIKEEGYEIACSAFYGLAGGKINWIGQSAITQEPQIIPVYPIVNHTYGSDAMVLHGRHFQADITMSLQDIWPMNPQDLQQVNRFIPWNPVDHDPIPQGVVNNLRFANRIIAMSKFGQQQMVNVGFSSTYIPHTVNTKIFIPSNRPERKQKAGLDVNTFVVGMVAANKELPPRKSFQEVLDAFKMFNEKIPNSVIYIHSNPDFPGGFPFRTYAQQIGIGNKLLVPDSYAMNFRTDKAAMNLIYGTFDLLVSPSVSEGFGICPIEAMATGIPVIVNDFSAQSELVVDGYNGYKTKIIQKRWSGMGSQTGVPSTKDLYEKMLLIYRGDRKKMGDNARKFVEKDYDLVKVWNTKWKVFFERIEKEIYGDISPVDNITK